MNAIAEKPLQACILVVEDEGIVAKDIQNRLRSLGYDVPLTVATGQAAIDVAGTHHPDLVLMDIMLRGNMDGVEAAEAIRKLYNIPVIYLTAYSDAHTLDRAKITEPFGYILKPFSEREILTSIEMALYKHRTDTELKESRRWLSTTLFSIGDAVISTDSDHRIRLMNTVAEQLTGWPIAEALGKKLDEVYKVITADESAGGGIILVARNGNHLHIEENSSPIRDEHEQEQGVVLVLRDVSELRKQRDLYESLLHAQSDLGEGFLIEDGTRIQYSNEAFSAITGYSTEELKLFPSFIDLLVPEERAAVGDLMLLRLTGGPAPDSSESVILHKSGAHVDVEIAVKRLGSNKENGIMTIVRDISVRKQAQAELLLTQLRLTTLFKNLPSVVLYETGGGREYISENIEQLLGYPVSKFVNDRNMFPSVMNPDDTVAVKKMLVDWHAAGEPGVLIYQFRARRADGSMVWLEDHMVEVKPKNDDKYMTGVMIDITERKRAEEELRIAKEKAEEYDRLKTNFISVISHEIRTPLNAILGCTKLVHNAVHENNNSALEESLQEYFSIVDRSGERLMKLIESFLDIAAIQAGNLKLKLINSPVETVVRQAVDELRFKIIESNLELIENYSAPSASARLDPERLAQIITNILANAVKFTPRGIIRVSTSEENKFVSITIEDTGIGISSAFIPNMFTPFRQGSEGSTRGYQGAGLGLSIAHRLIESMEGSLEVKSVEGKGTTVTVRFPIVTLDIPAPKRSTVEAATPRPPRPVAGAGHRALVVEDDYENMMYVRTVLRTNGWSVKTATNGDDALRLMAEELPHVVLMDINLIGSMNGFETLEAIRKNKNIMHVPIIAVTAHAFEEERQKILAAGFDDYLAKPFTPDQLREILSKHLLKNSTAQ